MKVIYLSQRGIKEHFKEREYSMYKGLVARGIMGEPLDEMMFTFSTEPPTIEVR